MIILLIGTIAQKYIGLYNAQNMFFSKFIFWIGPIPLPGGYSAMAIIAIGLAAKLIFISPWNKKHAGSIIIHIGALVLLIGSFITAIFSYEGSMVIYEGQSSDYISDYHKKELLIVKHNKDKVEPVEYFPQSKFIENDVLKSDKIPFNIDIKNYYRNSKISSTKLEQLNLNKDEETNIAGLKIKINDKELIIVENMLIPPSIEVMGDKYSFGIRKIRTYLPFKIHLNKFEKKLHPGTDIPKSYKSDVELIDEDNKWNTQIYMNNPLRYRGYTLFQSSFLETEDNRKATVLAVVNNAGRLFPYISSIVICIGLLIHLVIKMPKLFKN
ncbi:cytochrome c biogenesis protein ResB [Rickettsiales bacterium]|nr:cytochrome c biogenesis protein ResB [Rickettsiales bacterium]